MMAKLKGKETQNKTAEEKNYARLSGISSSSVVKIHGEILAILLLAKLLKIGVRAKKGMIMLEIGTDTLKI